MAVPVRADHVGSLLRPAELKQARDDYFAGSITKEQLTAIEDQAILAALELQRQTGIGILSDGEFRRESWAEAWARVLQPFRAEAPAAGLSPTPVNVWKGPAVARVGTTWRSRYQSPPAIVRRIDLDAVDYLTLHEVDFLSAHAKAPFKITFPGVGQIMPTVFQPGVTDRVYSSRGDVVQDLVSIVRREIQALLQRGVTYIQMDSLRYVIQIADPTRRQAMIDAGQDPEAELDETIAADNACIDGIDPGDAVIALHMCRGNNQSRWLAEGSYDAVAEKVFSQLRVNRLLLEYDDERSGGFEVLRYVPRDKTVVLGIVSSKRPELETVDFLCARIEEAGKYFPIEQMALSPQCGFASSVEGNLLTVDEQKRKLERIVETALKVWGTV